MILHKKLFLFQSVLFGTLIAIILSLNSCINSCDNTNSTFVRIGIDSTNKLKGTWFSSIGVDKKRISPSMEFLHLGAYKIPLNLDKDSTIITFFVTSVKTRKDSLIYRLALDYSSKPFLPGPDCGMDVRINNLNIRSHSFPEGKIPQLSTNQVTTAEAPNVKIQL